MKFKTQTAIGLIWLVSALPIMAQESANPEAEDARPAPVGKLLSVSTDTGGSPNCCLNKSKKLATFKSSILFPLSTRRVSVEVATFVVVVRLSRVIDTLGLAG